MGHMPHLYLPAPWQGTHLPLSAQHRHHLERVLRVRDGSPVSYTDGEGVSGQGVLAGGMVERGRESSTPSPATSVTIAAPPPDQRDRVRFLVEKLGELGVARLVWLHTIRGEGRVPDHDRSKAWAQSALEQSRGSYLLRVEGPVSVADLDPPLLVADPSGSDLSGLTVGNHTTVAVGPEGGWEPSEIPEGVQSFSLGDRVLRLETAAIASAAHFLVTGGAR